MESNPFAVLSLIVAPAILTNASSVLIMSTSNRLARSVDRARELAKQLEETAQYDGEEPQRRMKELESTGDRSLLILHALRSFYIALGAFASAAFVSLLGAVLAPAALRHFVVFFEIAAVTAGFIAVSSLVKGAYLLVRETRIAVQVITDRTANIRARILAGKTPAIEEEAKHV